MFAALPPLANLYQYDADGDVIMTDASPLATPPRPERLVVSPPPAPARAPAAGSDGGDSPVRNLAEAMAEAVLRDEPLAPAAAGAAEPVAPPPAEDWCVAVTCSDLALRLDMRHPRVVLNLLRFVSTYNELAPEGELINLPQIPHSTVETILSHDSVVHPPPEFAGEVRELRDLLDAYSACDCCGWDHDERSEDTEDEYLRRGSYYRYY